MFCKKCGAQLIKDAAFCTVCGEKVEAQISYLAAATAIGTGDGEIAVNNRRPLSYENTGSAYVENASKVSTPVKETASAEFSVKGSSIGYWLAFAAFGVMTLSFFLPFMSVKAWGYSLAEQSLFDWYVQTAKGEEILLPIGLGLILLLIFFKERWARITAGIIAMLCIIFPFGTFLVTRESYENLQFGGILYLLAGIALIVACFIPIETKDKPKKNWNHY